jgi:hypothetical protein
MGVWSVGLYAGDFAIDLRGTIAAVARLPFDGDRLAEILCEAEAGAANNSDDEDFTVFWLILADQFAKRGIASVRVAEKALTIIDDGSDLALAEKLGARGADLVRRQGVLAELRARLTAVSQVTRPRKVLNKPQPFLFETGEVLVYPTSDGKCINPYFRSKELMRGWRQDGWSAVLIVERGRAFDFLTWYRPLTVVAALAQRPALEALLGEVAWTLRRPGTCSQVHLKRIELESIGCMAIDHDKLVSAFPPLPRGTAAAVSDISIANQLDVGPDAAHLIAKPGQPGGFTHGRPLPIITRLDAVLKV